MRQGYQVMIEGRLLQGEEPRALLKRAVEVRRRLDEHRRCGQCGRVIRDPDLAEYRLCFSCVERAVSWYSEVLATRRSPRPEAVPAPEDELLPADLARC